MQELSGARMMEKVTALHKLYHEDGKSFYSAKSISCYNESCKDSVPDEIQTKFIDIVNSKAYSATIVRSLLTEIKENTLKKSGSDFDVWIRETFQDSSTNFTFTVVLDDKADLTNDSKLSAKYKLIWKKIEGKFKIRLAEIPLIPEDLFSVHQELFDTAQSQIQEYKLKAHQFERRESSLQSDLEEYRKHMTQFRDDKNSLEDKLYNAFLPILNSKKDEICKLKRKVGELPGYKDDTSEEENPEDTQNSKSNVSKIKCSKEYGTKNPKIAHTMSDSDDNPDSPDSNFEVNQCEPISNSQDILDMSPTLL